MKNKFVIVTHAVLSSKEDIAGPAHTLISYLSKRNIDNLFIRHALFKEGKTLVTFSHSGHKENITLESYNFSELLNRVVEGYRTIKYFFIFYKKDKPIYVGVDPLNCFWGLLLKKIGRVKKLIVFSADYSQKRYGNFIVNYLYHYIDYLTVNNSDYVWSVSKRIESLRIK